MQRSALCRSRRELSNEYLLAKFGFDAAENELAKVCRSKQAIPTPGHKSGSGTLAIGTEASAGPQMDHRKKWGLHFLRRSKRNLLGQTIVELEGASL